jgi:ATP-dependent Clp protease ATP-binding subunit ClpC
VRSRCAADLGVDPAALRKAVEARARPAKSPAGHGALPFTRDAKRVLESTLDEARRLGHAYIGTEHLLLGLLHSGGPPSADAFAACGVELEAARAKIVERTRADSAAPAPPESSTTSSRGCARLLGLGLLPALFDS